MPFVFYDTETTGVSRFYDQILQFAALYVDDDLREIDRVDLRCRLPPHVIPSPGAVLVTGIELGRLLDPALPSHHDFICQCHAALEKWSPAIFIGYNSLRFDETLLRQAFYQNLKPIYLTNTQGNGRQDVLPLIRAAHRLYPERFVIPSGEAGKPSFKLDRLAPANGFLNHNAHDAAGDARATLHLARLIKERAPDVWRRARALCDRSGVEAFLAAHACFALVANGRAHIVVPIGPVTSEDREVVCIRLNIDLSALEAMPDDELKTWLKSSPAPIRRFRKNAAPHLIGLDEAHPYLFVDMSADEARMQARLFRQNTRLQERIKSLLAAEETPYQAGATVEEQIYNGFYSNKDQQRIDNFHQAPWEERWEIVRQFDDPRLQHLGRRLLYLERPQALPASVRSAMERGLAKRMLGLGKDGNWTSLPEAMREVREAWRTATEPQKALLRPLRAYLLARKNWAKSVTAGQDGL